MNYPHTTEILKTWMNLEWVKPEDLARGSKRHAVYASHLLGVWCPPVDPRDQGQVDSFRRWIDKYVVNVWFVEKCLEDRDVGYGGTIDFGGELTICSGCVLDWKPPSAGGPVTRAQVASYLNVAQKNGYSAEKGGFLRMDSEGSVAKMTWIETSGVDFVGFLSGLNSFRYFKS